MIDKLLTCRTTAVTGKTVVSSNEGISVDDTSRDIFGDDGLAELNEALQQLNNIKAGLTFF